MSKSLEDFKTALDDSHNLLECYDNLNITENENAPEVLKRAALIMTLTAWETYIEDVLTEKFHLKFSIVSGSHIGNYLEKQLLEKLKYFNNPDSLKTKKIFEEFLNIDVTEKWSWNNYTPLDARTTLNKWIKMRGEAVHRAQVDSTTPDIIKRSELKKCLRFFSELAEVTDKCVDNI